MAQLPILGCVEIRKSMPSVSTNGWASHGEGSDPGFLIPSLEDSPSLPCLLWWFLVSACWWVHCELRVHHLVPTALACFHVEELPRYLQSQEAVRLPTFLNYSPIFILLFFYFFLEWFEIFCFISFLFLFTWLLGVLAAACGPKPQDWTSSALGAWVLVTGPPGSLCTTARKARSGFCQNQPVCWLHSPAFLCPLSLLSSLKFMTKSYY